MRNRLLTKDTGGAICLFSTLLYNIGLLSGMAIVERRCHSVDSYGDSRYFELGRDAAVEFPYVDLRFRNDFDAPMLLRASTGGASVKADAWSPVPLPLSVSVAVDAPCHEPPQRIITVDQALEEGSTVVDDPGLSGVRVRARRLVTLDGKSRPEDVWQSHHIAMPRRERIAPPAGP